MARIEQATGLAGLGMECPVKELALTVQQFVNAHAATDKAAVAAYQNKSHDGRVEHLKLRQRLSALHDLTEAKRDHALTMQAQSPEGALHQIALVSLYVETLWDLTPEQEKDSEAFFEAKHARDMTEWGLYSAATVLERLSAEPRDRLAVEYYMPSSGSPFSRTAGEPASIDKCTSPDERLREINTIIERYRATQQAAWRREDGASEKLMETLEATGARSFRDIAAYTMEAALLTPRSLLGFALKARLLTQTYGSEETSFTDAEDVLCRSLVAQLLAAAGLSRIDDNSSDAEEFLARSAVELSAEAA